MFNIVEQKKSYELKHFDFMNDDLDQYAKYFKTIKGNHKSNSLDLEYLSMTAKSRLRNIIDYDFFSKMMEDSTYNCPFTGYKHYSIVPVTILTDNPIHYIRLFHGVDINDEKTYTAWYTDMACDPTWNKDIDYSDAYSQTSKVDSILLGTGYTNFYMPNDGHSSNEIVAIELDNEDYILFIVKKWFNK